MTSVGKEQNAVQFFFKFFFCCKTKKFMKQNCQMKKKSCNMK